MPNITMNHLKIQCNCSPNQREASPTEGIYTLKVNIFCRSAFKQNHVRRQMKRTVCNSQVPTQQAVPWLDPCNLQSKWQQKHIGASLRHQRYDWREFLTERDHETPPSSISVFIWIRCILLFVSGCESPQHCNYVNLWSCGIWAGICKISVGETPC